jgi:hypothetical protein
MRHERSNTHAAGRPRRIYEEAPPKLSGTVGCPRCGASYHNGRWTRKATPADAHEHVCPACRRIEDDYPAGVIHVGGDFAAAHRDEIVGLMRNIEQQEAAEHPLKRIMAVSDEGRGFAVTATDAKLVESFGRALKKAYAGELEQPGTTSEKENLVRVRWHRD